jgi:hypothetical protein
VKTAYKAVFRGLILFLGKGNKFIGQEERVCAREHADAQRARALWLACEKAALSFNSLAKKSPEQYEEI